MQIGVSVNNFNLNYYQGMGNSDDTSIDKFSLLLIPSGQNTTSCYYRYLRRETPSLYFSESSLMSSTSSSLSKS